jgi:plastocyanin
MVIAVVAVAALAALALSGCSGTKTAKPPTTSPVQFVGSKNPTSSASEGHAIVTVTDSGANPSSVTVKVGGRVVWQNAGFTTHKIAVAGSATSPAIAVTKSASHVFDKPGTYTYSDPDHPEIKGTVIVTK